MGCDSPAAGGRVHFANSPHPTDRCPRRAINACPGLADVLDVYWHTDGGKLGADILRAPAPLVDALHLIAHGAQWARDQNAKDKQAHGP